MEDVVTIATFTYPTELAVIQGRLESEGIKCYVKDEYTVQVNNFLSNAIGGVKLQVKGSDVDKALKLLKEAGYIKEQDLITSKFWVTIDDFTGKIPLIKNARTELRFIIMVATILISLAGIITLILTPNTFESLTENSWCIDHISHEGEKYIPNSSGLQIIGPGFCNERIGFRENGRLSLPGFNTHSISGNWTLNGDIIEIRKVEAFPKMLEGDYTIEINRNEMILTSGKTIIYCYKTRY